MKHRKALELIWRAGVSHVDGHACVSRELGPATKVDAILAVGKAATPMLEAALAHCGHDTKSLLITKYGHVHTRHKFNQEKLEEYQRDGSLTVIEAGHPIPDQRSLDAGEAAINFVNDMAPGNTLLFLISGGASSLVELLPSDMTLEQYQVKTAEMLARGLDIEAINRKRQEISCIKNGKLLAEFAGAHIEVLAISDVVGDKLDIISSGIGRTDKVPDKVQTHSRIVANNAMARNACAQKAELLGFSVRENAETAYGDVEHVADKICDKVKNGPDGVYIYGGEPTVVLGNNPGRGGRNQHLAVLLARNLSGAQSIEFLIAGSDGTDGPTEAAGGFGDGIGFSSFEGGQAALDNEDAGTFLERSDMLFVSGPTGTNVMDIFVLIKG